MKSEHKINIKHIQSNFQGQKINNQENNNKSNLNNNNSSCNNNNSNHIVNIATQKYNYNLNNNGKYLKTEREASIKKLNLKENPSLSESSNNNPISLLNSRKIKENIRVTEITQRNHTKNNNHSNKPILPTNFHTNKVIRRDSSEQINKNINNNYIDNTKNNNSNNSTNLNSNTNNNNVSINKKRNNEVQNINITANPKKFFQQSSVQEIYNNVYNFFPANTDIDAFMKKGALIPNSLHHTNLPITNANGNLNTNNVNDMDINYTNLKKNNNNSNCHNTNSSKMKTTSLSSIKNPNNNDNTENNLNSTFKAKNNILNNNIKNNTIKIISPLKTSQDSVVNENNNNNMNSNNYINNASKIMNEKQEYIDYLMKENEILKKKLKEKTIENKFLNTKIDFTGDIDQRSSSKGFQHMNTHYTQRNNYPAMKNIVSSSASSNQFNSISRLNVKNTVVNHHHSPKNKKLNQSDCKYT